MIESSIFLFKLVFYFFILGVFIQVYDFLYIKFCLVKKAPMRCFYYHLYCSMGELLKSSYGDFFKKFLQFVIYSFILFLPILFFPFFESFVFNRTEYHVEIFLHQYNVFFFFIFLVFPVLLNFVGIYYSKSIFSFISERESLERFFIFFPPLCLSFISTIFQYGSFDFHSLVMEQARPLFLSFPKWGCFMMPVSAILFSLSYNGLLGEGAFSRKRSLSSLLSARDFNERSTLYIFYRSLMGIYFTILFVFLYMGGYSLLPGLGHFVEILPGSFYVLQFFSLSLKIFFVLVLNFFIESFIPMVGHDSLISIGSKKIHLYSLISLTCIILTKYVKGF